MNTGPRQPELAGLEGCTNCPRLAGFLEAVRNQHCGYFARPVPPVGDARPRLLVVGLAPGLHGANRTGRPFTGDYAGELLYAALHRFGWADRAVSVAADDGLVLTGCRITNAVKCVPPANKPAPVEIRTCNAWLADELAALAPGSAILALGRIAHDAVLMGLGLRASAAAFGHGARADLPGGRALFDSYHCSRYNTNTRRLTPAMFEDVFARVAQHLGRPAATP
jgi:uracil-DNA glycosylase family 4